MLIDELCTLKNGCAVSGATSHSRLAQGHKWNANLKQLEFNSIKC